MEKFSVPRSIYLQMSDCYDRWVIGNQGAGSNLQAYVQLPFLVFQGEGSTICHLNKCQNPFWLCYRGAAGRCQYGSTHLKWWPHACWGLWCPRWSWQYGTICCWWNGLWRALDRGNGLWGHWWGRFISWFQAWGGSNWQADSYSWWLYDCEV